MITARRIQAEQLARTDPDHASFGHRLLLIVFPIEIFDVGIDGSPIQLKTELLRTPGSEQSVDIQTGEAIERQFPRRRGLRLAVRQSSSPLLAACPVT